MRADETRQEPNLTPSARTARSASGWRTGYWVIIALLIAAYALCAAQATSDPSPSALVVQLLTVAAVLRVTGTHASVQRIAWVVLSLAAAAVIIAALLGTRGRILDVVLSAASMVAFFVAPVAIIRHQVMRRGLDIEALLAAIAAYVSVGMLYTFLYNLISLVTVTPTFGAQGADSLSTQLFFSFTTLTTTGYGNFVPVSAALQGVAVAEAITGQLFLITAVARIMRGARRPPFEGGSARGLTSDTVPKEEP